MQTVARQLELSLWSDLKAAISDPETADLQKLLQDLEQVVGLVQEDQRLLLAGEAIAQIVEVGCGQNQSVRQLHVLGGKLLVEPKNLTTSY